MKFLDRDHPFFAKPVTRWLSALLPLAWGGVEVWMGNPGGGMVFVAAGAWAGWELILRK